MSKKKMGLVMCLALVIGNMMGSGFFLLPASLAPYGMDAMWGWVITALGALLTASSFSRLSSRTSESGGPYIYARDGFGNFPGFLVAWGYWISIWCGNAAIAIAMASYLTYFSPGLESWGWMIALIAIWTLTLFNLGPIRWIGFLQVATTFVKVLPVLLIAAFGFIGLGEMGTSLTLQSEGSFSSINQAAALTLWAFLGFESASVPAQQVDQPQKNIPRATWLGTLIVGFVYMSSTLALFYMIPADDLANSKAPFADAAQSLWGPVAGEILALVAVVSCFGALNGWVMCQGQIPMAAAQDGFFPARFAEKSKHQAPKFALLLSSGLASVLVVCNFSENLVALFTFAILLSTLTVLVPYLFAVAADLKVLFKDRGRFWAKLASIFALIYCSWAILGIGWKAILWGLALLASGCPVYLHLRKKT